MMAERKPVDATAQQRLKRARLGRLEQDHQRIWSQLQDLRGAHPRELARETGLHEQKIGFYLGFLERAGYVWLEPGKRLRRFWLVRETGQLAPVRLRGGQAVKDLNTGETYPVPECINRWPDCPAARDSLEQKSWLAMRMLRTFTVSELATVTELKARPLKRRVKQLLSFRYLRQVEHSGGEPGYLLPQYRNTGPKAPVIHPGLNSLYDFNSKEVMVNQ